MPSLDQFCRHFFQRPGIGRTLLLGSLLSFIPLVNLLACGYLWRSARRVKGKQLDLADWSELPGLFVDGVRFAILFILYGVLPALAGWLLALAVGFVTFGFLGWLSFVFVSAGLIVGPILFANAVYANARRKAWLCLLDWREVALLARNSAPSLVIPTLALWGFVFLGAPLYGFAFFCGILIYLSFSLLVIRSREPDDSAQRYYY